MQSSPGKTLKSGCDFAQRLAKLIARGGEITLHRTRNPNAMHRRAIHNWTINQPFACHALKRLADQGDAAPCFHLGNQRTGTIHFGVSVTVRLCDWVYAFIFRYGLSEENQ
jgi:hypothetical protein